MVEAFEKMKLKGKVDVRPIWFNYHDLIDKRVK